jgi:putative tricarboxylic transport membrane protein
VDAPADDSDHPRLSPRKLNFNAVAALVSVVFAAVLFFITPYQVEKPVVVFGQSLNALDPTLFPRLVALGIFGLGIRYFFKSFSLHEHNRFRDLDREGYINVGVSLAAFTLYALLMEPLGFILSSVLLVAGLSTFYGVRNRLLVAAVSVGIPVAIYFAFTRMLQVFLPAFPEL